MREFIVDDDDLPPMRVDRFIEVHRCEHCGSVCPNCAVTDERRDGAKPPVASTRGLPKKANP